MHEEGWYTDPFGLHDARWMSDGRPTGLVRDGDVESNEPVPDGPPTKTSRRLGAEGAGGLATSDVLEANKTTGKPPDYGDAAEEGFDSSV